MYFRIIGHKLKLDTVHEKSFCLDFEDDPDPQVSDNQAASIDQLELAANLNLAQCHLKLENGRQALKFSDAVRLDILYIAAKFWRPHTRNKDSNRNNHNNRR